MGSCPKLYWGALLVQINLYIVNLLNNKRKSSDYPIINFHLDCEPRTSSILF